MKATINLAEENVRKAEAELERFAQSIRDGVTVYSTKGLLSNILLLDLDMEVQS
jgi:hypothetical protein